MENKAHALVAGAFVLLVAALLVTLAMWMTHDAGLTRSYEVSTGTAVNGLEPQASVRFRGVKVGKVEAIGFDPKLKGHVLVRIDINQATPVTRSTYATLGFHGVTGIAYLQLDDSGESSEPLTTRASEPGRIPLRPGLLDRFSRQGGELLTQLEETSRRVNLLLAPENQKALMASITAMGQASADMPALVRETGAAMQAVRAAAANVADSADEVKRAATDYRGLAGRLQQPGGTLDQLREGAGALAATGQALQQSSLPRLNRALEDAGRSVRQVGRAAATLDDNPQSLIYGPPRVVPGPGEAGFVAPGAGR